MYYNKKLKAHMAHMLLFFYENNNFFEDQGNSMSHDFEDLPTGYLLAKFQFILLLPINSVWDIVKNGHTDG